MNYHQPDLFFSGFIIFFLAASADHWKWLDWVVNHHPTEEVGCLMTLGWKHSNKTQLPLVHYPLVQMAAPHCLFEKRALAVSSARLRQHPTNWQPVAIVSFPCGNQREKSSWSRRWGNWESIRIWILFPSGIEKDKHFCGILILCSKWEKRVFFFLLLLFLLLLLLHIESRESRKEIQVPFLELNILLYLNWLFPAEFERKQRSHTHKSYKVWNF